MQSEVRGSDHYHPKYVTGNNCSQRIRHVLRYATRLMVTVCWLAMCDCFCDRTYLVGKFLGIMFEWFRVEQFTAVETIDWNASNRDWLRPTQYYGTYYQEWFQQVFSKGCEVLDRVYRKLHTVIYGRSCQGGNNPRWFSGEFIFLIHHEMLSFLNRTDVT